MPIITETACKLFLTVAYSLLALGAFQDSEATSVSKTPSTSATTVLKLANRVSQTDDSDKQDKVSFANEIRPIFKAHCYSCHGPEKQESNYRLDVKIRALGEADFGSAPIVPKDPSNSPLFQYISDPESVNVMPPPGKSKRLSKKQLATIERWIEEGAQWPAQFAGEENQKLTTDHWSFQPIAKPDVPKADHSIVESTTNPIDNFVLAKLATKGLQPSTPADRVTWVRRVYLNMHGLLPTKSQVDSFVNDTTSGAKKKVIEDVLASSHYGERWARHWLDVARFAESTGYEINSERKNAYFYRDFVINSFNTDMPYDRFVAAQIAGDTMGIDAATGFLVGGSYDAVKSPDINLTLMQREDELADYVNTTSTAFLGLTVGCARCHNHKFDPILQKDYFAMQAVFAGVVHGERKIYDLAPYSTTHEQGRVHFEYLFRGDGQARRPLLDQKTKLAAIEKHLAKLRDSAPIKPDSGGLLPMVTAKMNKDEFEPVLAKFIRFTILKTNRSEACIDELEVFSPESDKNMALATLGSKPTSSGDFPGYEIHKLKHINDGVYGNSNSWISSTLANGWVQIELPKPTKIHRVLWGRDRIKTSSDRLATEYRIDVSLNGNDWTEASGSSRRKVFTGDGKEPEDAFIARLEEQDAADAKLLFVTRNKVKEEIQKLEASYPTAYIGTFKQPTKIHRLYRGDPKAPREEVSPDAISVIKSLGMDGNTPDRERRWIFANWVASADNPLTARVIVNRVWHYHFGRGIVATPSDFGKNGIPPTHPELLDWLASEFIANGWSLKWLHQTILSSSTFAQSSKPQSTAIAVDADNHYLWRFTPRRLEAESIRDCVLQVSNKLNLKAGGPGFKLFKTDSSETVHHYFPLEEFKAEHFRRMIYMTKIRQEQDEVFGVFDCPDGGQVIPNRSRSTTPLQALNLLNSKFMLGQADFLATRLAEQAGEEVESQIKLAFLTMFLREPAADEVVAAKDLIESHGLKAFCRAMLNANEFLFVS